MSEQITTEGRKVYVSMMEEFENKIDFQKRMVKDAAVRFADSNKPEDRSEYQRLKTGLAIWETASLIVVNEGGTILRLDLPK